MAACDLDQGQGLAALARRGYALGLGQRWRLKAEGWPLASPARTWPLGQKHRTRRVRMEVERRSIQGRRGEAPGAVAVALVFALGSPLDPKDPCALAHPHLEVLKT